jgi:hypothetical protein
MTAAESDLSEDQVRNDGIWKSSVFDNWRICERFGLLPKVAAGLGAPRTEGRAKDPQGSLAHQGDERREYPIR